MEDLDNMLIVYTWHRGNIKAVVVFCAFDQSSLHWGLFANVALGLAADKYKCIYCDNAFTLKS